MAPPFREAEFDIIFQGDTIGISWEGDLLDIGVDKGFIDKSGAWFSYEGERLGQGRDNVKAFLKGNPEIAGQIEGKLRVELGLGGQEGAEGEEAAEEEE